MINIGNDRIFSLGISGRWCPVPALELEGALYRNQSEVTQRALEIVKAAGIRSDYPAETAFGEAGRPILLLTARDVPGP